MRTQQEIEKVLEGYSVENSTQISNAEKVLIEAARELLKIQTVSYCPECLNEYSNATYCSVCSATLVKGDSVNCLKTALAVIDSLRAQLASANEKLERLETSFKVEQAFRNEYGKRIDQLQQSLLNLTAQNERLREALTISAVDRGDCERFGVDFSKHECGCDVCALSNQLCPATQSSIIQEIQARALSQSSIPSTTLATVKKAFELLQKLHDGCGPLSLYDLNELLTAAKKENLI